jgi:hypothetical protein
MNEYHRPGELLSRSAQAAQTGEYAGMQPGGSTMSGVYAGAPVLSEALPYDRITQEMLSPYGNNAAATTPGYSIAPAPAHARFTPALSTNSKPPAGSYDMVPSAPSNESAASSATASHYSLAPAPATSTLGRSGTVAEKAAAKAPVCSTPALLQYAWYHGTISREESEALLEGREAFCFLVRDSNQGPNTFTVSVVKYVGGVAHILAQPVTEKGRLIGYKFGKTDAVVYRSLPHLIESYLAMKGSMKTLGTALDRNAAKK